MLLLAEQMTHACGQMMVHCKMSWYLAWCADGTDCTDCGTCTGARAQVEITNEQASAKKADIYASMQEIMDRYKSQDTRSSDEEVCLSFSGPDVACDGVCFSDAVVDECGVCGGSGIAEGACDCAGNVLDCSDTCGGDASD